MAEKQERFSGMTDGTGIVDQIIVDRSVGDKWYMGIDFDSGSNAGEVDLGTRRIPMSRVALLTQSGLVPASMLPSTVSSMVEGDMERDSATGQWTFTDKDGNVYGCPAKTGLVPDPSVVYVDNTPAGEDYYQYMFVPAVNPTDDDIGTFYGLPSPYMLVDGDGTHIHDDADEYTRSVNVVCADADEVDPDQTDETQPIKLVSVTDPDTGTTVRKLTHAAYTASSVNMGPTGNQSPGFGDTFAIPRGIIDRSGHVREAGTCNVTVPSTAATASVAGLVKISADAPKPIGTTGSSGNKKSDDGYFLVSAADHVHSAAKLSVTGTTVTYDGSASATIDLNAAVGATLPSTGPTEDSVLYYNGTALEWRPIDNVVENNFVRCSSSAAVNIVPGQAANISAGVASVDQVGGLSVGTGGISGVTAGRTYMVTYTVDMEHAAATEYYETFSVNVYLGSALCMSRHHTVDGSRTSTQYATGSGTFICPNGQTGLLTVKIDGGDASTFSGGQYTAKLSDWTVVEVK